MYSRTAISALSVHVSFPRLGANANVPKLRWSFTPHLKYLPRFCLRMKFVGADLLLPHLLVFGLGHTPEVRTGSSTLPLFW
jgi:hypothetical protein